MSRLVKLGLAAATTAAAGAIVFGGHALADAASTTAGSGTAAATSGSGSGGSADTPVTGAELTKVTAAVKAKDSAVTVTSVQKDPDGSYDVDATKAGAKVRYDVSATPTTADPGCLQRPRGRVGSDRTRPTAWPRCQSPAFRAPELGLLRSA